MATLDEMFGLEAKRPKIYGLGKTPRKRKHNKALQGRNKTCVMVGVEIAKARLLVGISQKELGDRVHSNQVGVSNIENGHINMTIKTLQKIADALDMDLDIRLVPKS